MSEARPSFSLRPWAWLSWLPLAAATYVTARHSGDEWYAAGAVLGSLVPPLLISWLVWRFGRPSATRASAVFLAVVLVTLLVRLAQMAVGRELHEKKRATEEVLADFGKETQALRDQAAAELESGEASAAAGIERSAAVMEKAGERLQGSVSSMMLAVAEAYRELLPAARSYDAAWIAFSGAGGVDASTIESREQIAERTTLAGNALAASRAFRKAVESFPATAETRVRAVPASDSEKRDFIAGMSAGLGRFVRSLRTVDHDVEAAEIMIEMFRLLDREWGRWRVNGDELGFENAAALEPYDKLANRLQAVLGEQQRIAKESLAEGGAGASVR